MDRTIPIWEKYTLTIEEASDYFHIGTGKLRRLISSNPNADWILWNASHVQIKRKKFESYIYSINSI